MHGAGRVKWILSMDPQLNVLGEGHAEAVVDIAQCHGSVFYRKQRIARKNNERISCSCSK